ncbi:MAG: D-alanyl-D-alanine carboxypeptidase family protein [Eubacteriales bacterium]|nr:D-alanyl-D-alanine carboxypeptidase family protein [Eubacteriales bacterium]
MKKFYSIFFLLLVTLTLAIGSTLCLPANIQEASVDETVDSKSFSKYMTDFDTGLELYSYKPDEKHEIASMVKIMTALLTLEEIDKGNVTLDEKVTISANSSAMGGSQMFLETGDSYAVTDLLKGIIVVSANDASVAMAERIAGSHEAFVEMMNLRAKELGMNNTLFCSATGLPSEREQYSTARDVNIMTRELMKHDKYYDYASIYLENYTHPDGRITQLVNTNKLIRHYKGCIGGKTGYTAKAGFCLSACAQRNGLKVVATVIGCNDSKTRFNQVSKLFDYGFGAYKQQVVYSHDQDMPEQLAVKASPVKSIAVRPERDVAVLCKGGEKLGSVSVNLPQYVKAPIKKGDVVGSVTITTQGNERTVNLVAEQDADKASLFDYFKDLASQW